MGHVAFIAGDLKERKRCKQFIAGRPSRCHIHSMFNLFFLDLHMISKGFSTIFHGFSMDFPWECAEDWLLNQRKGSVTVSDVQDRDDCTEMHIPENCKGLTIGCKES